MNSRLVIDDSHQLREFRDTNSQPQNPALRILAKLISYIFHPLFVPVYIIAFMIWTPPFFAAFKASDKFITLVRFFVMYSFFPLVTVLLIKGLGFIDSIYLKTQKDRIIPYIACGMYYFWMWYVLRNQSQFVPEVVQLAMAIFLASSIGLIANIFMKISMHAISMGILVVFVGLLATTQSVSYTIYLSVACLIGGIVCTSRLIVSDHTTREIYMGLLVGGLSQLIAVWTTGILT